MRLLRLLQNKPRTEQLIAYLILGLTLGIMAGVVAPSLNTKGFLVAWDAGGHLLKAHYFAHHLLPHGYLSGWFPVWHGGFDLFQFYPPLLYYLLGPLTLVTKPELALRIVTAALWLGLVPATYYFLRSFQLNRLIAAAGSSFLLVLNASFGVGLGALYGVGLLPNGLGFILAIWALGRLKRDLSAPERRAGQLVLTGLLFGLLVLAHTFSAYWWMAASLILLISETLGRPRHLVSALVKRYLLVIALGMLISAYWWVPLFLNITFIGQTEPIQQISRLEIFKGLALAEDSGGWIMAALSLLGILYLGFSNRARAFGFFVGTAAFSLLLALNIINGLLPFSTVVGSSQFIRFQAFFAWLMMIFAVFGLYGIWRLVRRIPLPYVPTALTVGVFVLIYFLVLAPTLAYKQGFIRMAENESTAELPGAAAYLDQHLRSGEFILSEFNWSSRYYFGSPHYINQRLPLLSNKIRDLDGNFPEGTIGSARPVLIAKVLDQTDYLSTQQDYLKSRGIRYIVTTHPSSKSKLLSQTWLRLVWQGDVLTIFEIVDFNRPFGLTPALAGKLTNVTFEDTGRYQLHFSGPVDVPAGTTFALSGHPWLKASMGGRSIPTKIDDEGRLQLAQAASGSTLEITYQPSMAAYIANIVSIMTLIGSFLLLTHRRWLLRLVGTVRRRRPPAKQS